MPPASINTIDRATILFFVVMEDRLPDNRITGIAMREGNVVRDCTAERLASGKASPILASADERATMEVRAKEGERMVTRFKFIKIPFSPMLSGRKTA